MTVTPAPVTSSVGAAPAADHHPSPARSSDQISRSHDRSFSQLLNDRMQGEKEQAAREVLSQTKASSPNQTSKAASQADTSISSADTAATKQSADPSTNGKLELAVGQSEDDQLANQATGQSGAIAANPAPDAALSLLDRVLSGNTLGSTGGSMLMARLMQSTVGVINLPGPSQAKSAIVEKKQSTTNTTQGTAPMPLIGAVPTLITAPVAEDSAKGEGVIGINPATDSARVDQQAPDSAPVAAMSGHLAFALRLNAGMNTPAAETPTPAAESAAIPSSSSAPASSASVDPINSMAINLAATSADTGKKEHANSDSKDGGTAIALADVPVSANSNADSVVAPSEAPASAQLPVDDDRLQEYSSEPVQNVQMQVIGDDNRRVDIRLMDRAGELRVSVKSGDSALNQTLQSRMPELTSRLEAAEYRTEVWMPASTQQDQSSGDINAGGQQGQQQRPNWVADLEGATSQDTERNY